MSNNIQTKIAVLGGGPAGYVAAIRASQLGADVVLVEKNALGGVCMNVGCIPTKALLKSAETITLINRSKEFGAECTLQNILWDVAVTRKDRMVKNLHAGLQQLLKAKGVTVLNGKGTVNSSRQISVITEAGTVVVNCEKMILATGSSPAIPKIKGILSAGVMTSTDALALQELPGSIAIIGGGVIGLEFASMFNASGVKVTVIEYEDSILPQEDSEIAAEMLKLIKRQGVSFKLSSKVNEIKQDDAGLIVLFESNGKESEILCEKVLVATGRKFNTDLIGDLPLETEEGHIVVNDYLETSVEGVFAAGDVIGGKLLAHLAFIEGKTAAENALGLKHTVNYNAVPACVYTSPEIATVGMTEAEAKAKGIAVKTGRFAFRHNGRALTLGDREGYVKIITDENNVIIGGQILGTNASEMISEITLAITLRATAETMADMIHPHPSMSEAIWEACNDAIGRSIHQI